MKDLRITANRQKKELIVFSFCFLLSFVINIISIVVYNTSWIEVIQSIGYVVVLAVFLYILFTLIRLLWLLLRSVYLSFSKKA